MAAWHPLLRTRHRARLWVAQAISLSSSPDRTPPIQRAWRQRVPTSRWRASDSTALEARAHSPVQFVPSSRRRWRHPTNQDTQRCLPRPTRQATQSQHLGGDCVVVTDRSTTPWTMRAWFPRSTPQMTPQGEPHTDARPAQLLAEPRESSIEERRSAPRLLAIPSLWPGHSHFGTCRMRATPGVASGRPNSPAVQRIASLARPPTAAGQRPEARLACPRRSLPHRRRPG